MKQLKNATFFIILLLILLTVAVLWFWSDYPATHIISVDGIRDLHGMDFTSGCFDIYGPVEYIPNMLLTPSEVNAHQSEIRIGDPEKAARYSTSRLRVNIPAGTYGIMMFNAEYATNIFINGELAESVGSPASDEEHVNPAIKLLYFTTAAPDGVIEIVQQASAYLLPEGGSHADIIIGKPEVIRVIYDKQNTISAIVMGSFLALFLAHIVLYSMLRGYKANLWFALFCFVWFGYTGYTYPWVLSSMFPLPWAAIYRLNCLAYPIALLLSCLTLNEIFPSALHKPFRIALYALCGIFACICLFAEIILLSNIALFFNAFIFLASVYILIRLCVKVRKPNVDQIAILTGMGIFIFCALRDILINELIPLFNTLPETSELTVRTTAEYALLVFVLFQMTAVFRDTMRQIAAAREAEQQSRMEAETLRRLNQAKEEYLSELSHELRTPIATISGFSQYFQELLDDEVLDRVDLKNSARWMESEADRMDRLVGQLLDMAAIEAGRFTIKKEQVSVNELFSRICNIYFPMLNGSGNRLIIDSQAELSVFADFERILQVLVNFVSNSCKYTAEGEITLTAADAGDIVYISVTDTGDGISPEVLPALFTRYPERASNERDIAGNGLGLYISKKLVEAHGGEIGVDSKVGRGTKIWFTIPAWEETQNE